MSQGHQVWTSLVTDDRGALFLVDLQQLSWSSPSDISLSLTMEFDARDSWNHLTYSSLLCPGAVRSSNSVLSHCSLHRRD